MQILQTRSVGEAALAKLLLALIRLHCRAASKAVLSIIKVEENWPIAVHQVQIGNIRVQGTTTLPVQYSASPHPLSAGSCALASTAAFVRDRQTAEP